MIIFDQFFKRIDYQKKSHPLIDNQFFSKNHHHYQQMLESHSGMLLGDVSSVAKCVNENCLSCIYSETPSIYDLLESFAWNCIKHFKSCKKLSRPAPVTVPDFKNHETCFSPITPTSTILAHLSHIHLDLIGPL